MTRRPSEQPSSGFGRPPKQHQFKPGQSGNPRGRPKKPQTLDDQILKVLNRKISLTGQSKKVSLYDALIISLRNQALSGERRALALIKSILNRAGWDQAVLASERPTNSYREKLAKVIAEEKSRQKSQEPPDPKEQDDE